MRWWHRPSIWKVSLPIVLIAILAVVWLLKPPPHHIPRIVVILPSDTNPYWIEVQGGAEHAKAELADKYLVEIKSSANMDSNSQVMLLDNYLSRGAVDALVLGPANDHETIPAVAQYSARGIPVIIIDTELDGREAADQKVKIAAFIGSDNIDGGRKAAAAIATALTGAQSKRVLLIEGSRVHQSAIDRADGFEDVAKQKGLFVVPARGEWKRDTAQEIVASKLSHDQFFDAIFASNDDMALGAVAALKVQGTTAGRYPLIVGFDATKDGLAAVDSREMYATVEQDAHGMGELGVRAAVEALEHDPSLLPKLLLPVKVRFR